MPNWTNPCESTFYKRVGVDLGHALKRTMAARNPYLQKYMDTSVPGKKDKKDKKDKKSKKA
jgi:hypothetical protein